MNGNEIVLACTLASALAAPAAAGEVPMGTYSIVAHDPLTGDLGVAVQSKFLGVGVVVPYAKAGVGAIATQAYANTTYGPRGLALLEKGRPPEEVVRELTADDPDREHRQVGIVDTRGRQSAALLVVRARGGYGRFNDRFVDIRVDDSPDPVAELKRIYALWERTFLIWASLSTAEDFVKAGKTEAARVERERALATIERILVEKPQDAEVLNDAAWTLATHNLQLERALELAQRAVELAPTTNHIRDTLAEAHFRKGNIDKAIEIESELVRKEPNNPDYARRLERFRRAKQSSLKN